MTKQTINRQVDFEYRSLQDAVNFANENNLSLDDITLESNDVGQYSSSHSSCLIYRSLETDEEYKERLEKEQYHKSIQEERDRKDYERLHKEFGNSL